MNSLAEHLKNGVKALQAQRYAEAVDALSIVVGDADLAIADDLTDVRARALSLYAQALIETGEYKLADHAIAEALRLVRTLDDADGLAELRSLQNRVSQARAEQLTQVARDRAQQHVRTTSLQALLADATTPQERVEARVRKATAHADVAEFAIALPLAERATTEADTLGDVRLQVLARIALARCHTDKEYATRDLAQAHQIAAQADETNLVSTVVRAAEVIGVALPEEPGPHHGRPV